MTHSELRKRFIEFFKGKGHTAFPSASLIPENDSTVLFTTAGMHPLIPYLLGEAHPGGKRLVSVQKCIRTGDIDEVGDDVHLTFFEMLGNWSLGDYGRKEAIEWSFEFLTKELKLPLHKLAVSCFAGDSDAPRDEESATIWESLGIPKDRIYFFSKKDNWWGPAGQTGPCGPDTEMFYWTGTGDPEPLTTGDNKEKWVEIWNDVFMEYEKTKEGTCKPLTQKNVDTGMGLERTLAVLNGKKSVFETDEFQSIFSKIKEHVKKSDEKGMRIFADHIKAAVFILGDPKGIVPSNVDQGYVVRRLIRRAIRYGKLMEGKENLILSVAEEVIREFQDEYPELKQNRGFIFRELKTEEEKFGFALGKGLKEFRKLVSGKVGEGHTKPESLEFYLDTLEIPEITGTDLFLISSTYGFPLEMCLEELSMIINSWYKINNSDFNIAKIQFGKRLIQEFEDEFKKHQELSRTASVGKFKGGLADNSEEVVKLHTATHLLHQALMDVLGGEVDQKGSNITSERLRFDFVCPRKVTSEELKRVEEIVNKKIKEDLPVRFEILSVADAKEKGAIGIFDEKYSKLGEKVKAYFVGEYSKEICGGPHVEHTGVIGSFKIQKEEAVAAGVRRIKAVVGK